MLIVSNKLVFIPGKHLQSSLLLKVGATQLLAKYIFIFSLGADLPTNVTKTALLVLALVCFDHAKL